MMKYTDHKMIQTGAALSEVGFWFLVGVMAVLMASLLMIGITYTLTL
jgi:hypothetical protein